MCFSEIYTFVYMSMGFPGGSVVKNLPAKQEAQIWFLAQEDTLVKQIATHSSFLAWDILWTRSLAGYSPCSPKETQFSN